MEEELAEIYFIIATLPNWPNIQCCDKSFPEIECQGLGNSLFALVGLA